jgi:uncharacterized protein YbjT (DUF2867 family)
MPVDIHESGDLNSQHAGADKAVLVFGATGQQGGAVASALKSQGWPVRALVRDPGSDKAKALLNLGVELFQGDFADIDSIRRAMSGAYGVFSVQPSSGQGALYGTSDEQEIRYGKSVADIAIETGVRHLVYTSVNAAGSGKTGMGHLDSKSDIEAHVRGTGLQSTIIRPAGFMELLMLPGMGLDKGAFMSFLRPEQTGQVIAVQDIGKIVASIFSDPDKFVGRTIEIAGDEVTGITLQDSLSHATGAPITYHRFPDSLLKEDAFLGRIASLVDDGRLAGHADIAALKAEFGHLLSFDEWLAGPGKPLFESALQAEAATIALR